MFFLFSAGKKRHLQSLKRQYLGENGCGLFVAMTTCKHSCREATKDVMSNPRELNQAVTFLHENGWFVSLHSIENCTMYNCYDKLKFRYFLHFSIN